MENYNYEWLFERLTEVRMAEKVIPNFWIGNDDPDHIKDLKDRLYVVKCDLEYIQGLIYKYIKEEK